MNDREFVLVVTYKSKASNWDVVSHDVVEAKDLLELVTKFNVLIARLHRTILKEEVSAEIDSEIEDVPF